MHERVHVAVRIRPFIESDSPTSELCTEVDESKSHVTVNAERVFAVDRVFGLNDDTEMLFDTVVCSLLDDFANGFNATIMAYGQTGTGKTYTIDGIIPHVLEYLIRIKFGGSTTQLSFQYVEVYGETIRDLLVDNPEANATSLQVVDAATYEQYLQQVNNDTDNRERMSNVKDNIENKYVGDVDPDVMSYAAGTFLLGATRTRANSLEEVMQMYRYGTSMRATGYTDMSAHSSRSHSIFTIFNHRVNENTVRCKLNLVDLAGSERNKKTHNVGVRFQESIGINSGLLALGKVIRALSQNYTRFRTAAITDKSSKFPTEVNEKNVGGGGESYMYFVPYRSSKLTRLLQDALGGNSKTLFIACVAPDQYNSDETIRTLQYCALARKVINIPERCQERLYGSPSRSRNPSRGRTRHPSPAQRHINSNDENDESIDNNNNSKRDKEREAFNTLQKEYNILQNEHVELQSHLNTEHNQVVKLQTELAATQRKLHICTEELKEDREVFALQIREVEKLVATNNNLQSTIRSMERNSERLQHTHTSIGMMTEEFKTDALVQTDKCTRCDNSPINVVNQVHQISNESSNTNSNLTSSTHIDDEGGDGEGTNKNEKTLNEHIMPIHEVTALASRVMEYQVSNNELRQRLSAVVSLLDNQQRENALLKLELNEALRAIMPQYTRNHYK